MATIAKPLAVVTGASSGIGLELARQFAQNGFDLLIASKTDEINEAAFQLEAEGARVKPVQVDLASKDGVEQLYREIQACGCPVDAIALNAGVGVGGEFLTTDIEEEMNMINLNVISTTLLAKMVLKDMARIGKGRVLFTASVVSVTPAPYQAVYSATKAYVLNLSEALRQEFKDSGITITALMPGATDTEFFEKADLEDTKIGQAKKDDPADVARDGFKALMAGKDKVVAHSMMSKMLGVMGELMPDAANATAMAKMNEPGSAKN